MAALEVVFNRLEKANLAPFCLQLHSTKARKTEILHSLLLRDELQNRLAHPTDIKETLFKLKQTRKKLTSYASLINQPFANINKSIHEILWAELSTRKHENNIPKSINKLWLKNAENYTSIEFSNYLEQLKCAELAFSEIANEFNKLELHPWCGIRNTNLTQYERENLYEKMKEWEKCFQAIIDKLEICYRDLSYIPEKRISSIISFINTLKALPNWTDKVDSAILSKISDEKICSEIISFLKLIEAYSKIISELSKCLKKPSSQINHYEKLFLLNSKIENMNLRELTLDKLKAEIAKQKEFIEAIDDVSTLLSDIAKLFENDKELNSEDNAVLVEAAEFLVKTERNILINRKKELIDENNREILLRGKKIRDEILGKRKDLESKFYLSENINISELREHVTELRNAGAFSFFNSGIRAAKKKYKTLSQDPTKLNNRQMAENLFELASYLDELKNFENEPSLKNSLSNGYIGVSTNFDQMIKVNEWSGSVRTTFAGPSNIMLLIRSTILEGNIDTLDAICSLAKSELLKKLKYVVAELKIDKSNTLAGYISKKLEQVKSFEDIYNSGEAIGLNIEMPFSEISKIYNSLKEAFNYRQNINKSDEIKTLLGNSFSGAETKLDDIRPTVSFAEKILALNLPKEISEKICSDSAKIFIDSISQACNYLENALKNEKTSREEVIQLADLNANSFFNNRNFLDMDVSEIKSRVQFSFEHQDCLDEWINYERTVNKIAGIEVGQNLLDAYAIEGMALKHLQASFKRIFYRSLTKEIYSKYPELNEFEGLTLKQTKLRFKELDKNIIELHRKNLVAELVKVPVDHGIGYGKKSDYTELSLIHNELSKKKRHIPLRSLMMRAGKAIKQMKPCFLMSPISVAQFLEPSGMKFDLVIIDEASQMKTEEALGALARANQAVVVGDPKQLPPTTFFEHITEAEDYDEDEQLDTESILDGFIRVFRPARELRWHYRSHHESLIAFSNFHFYENNLIVFPSPIETHSDYGVRLVYVGGKYKGRKNIEEATQITEAAVDFMSNNPNRSLGIVAINQEQRDFIDEEMDFIFSHNKAVENYRVKWKNTLYPFFVKNLENVQGDERDVIFISTVYGADESGTVMQRFGPINNVNGHRRLNVLFTRAKYNIVVFTSMRPDEIKVDMKSSQGKKILRAYIEYAKTGRLESGQETGREPDSDFEIFVKEQLELLGCEVVAQVGVAGFFIDLGVRHPDFSDGFLCGIECDGAMYHSAKSARDRDRLREEVLKGLGWRIYRIWSTDWFNNTNKEVEKLKKYIQSLLNEHKNVTKAPEILQKKYICKDLILDAGQKELKLESKSTEMDSNAKKEKVKAAERIKNQKITFNDVNIKGREKPLLGRCIKCRAALQLTKGPFGYYLKCNQCLNNQKIEIDLLLKIVKQDINCPKHPNMKLKVKSSKRGYFMGCPVYPKCRHTQIVEILKEHT